MARIEGRYVTLSIQRASGDQRLLPSAERPFVAAGQQASAVPCRVERVTPRAMIAHQVAWQSLCERAIEPNIFLEPAFALPLMQHVPSSRDPEFLLVWEEADPLGFDRLIGLLPIRAPNAATPNVLCGFADDQVRLGTPVVDRDRGLEALDAMLTWLQHAMPKIVALRLTALDAEGRFCALLAAHCVQRGRATRRFGEHRRAVLLPAASRATNVMPFAHVKRRKELRRQTRRLSERGVRTYSSARTPEEVARATERFLALEHDGWKGHRGTALLARPALATFTRSMTRLMAHEGKCRIDSIEIDGAAVAMGIVLTVGGRAHFWKTTFHEAFAPLSPGVQFTLELTEHQLGDPSVTLTDSCAVPDHPMIDRLWPDRMAMTDVLVALRPGASAAFAWTCRIEHWGRACRAKAKAIYLRGRSAVTSR